MLSWKQSWKSAKIEWFISCEVLSAIAVSKCRQMLPRISSSKPEAGALWEAARLFSLQRANRSMTAHCPETLEVPSACCQEWMRWTPHICTQMPPLASLASGGHFALTDSWQPQPWRCWASQCPVPQQDMKVFSTLQTEPQRPRFQRFQRYFLRMWLLEEY